MSICPDCGNELKGTFIEKYVLEFYCKVCNKTFTEKELKEENITLKESLKTQELRLTKIEKELGL